MSDTRFHTTDTGGDGDDATGAAQHLDAGGARGGPSDHAGGGDAWIDDEAYQVAQIRDALADTHGETEPEDRQAAKVWRARRQLADAEQQMQAGDGEAEPTDKLAQKIWRAKRKLDQARADLEAAQQAAKDNIKRLRKDLANAEQALADARLKDLRDADETAGRLARRAQVDAAVLRGLADVGGGGELGGLIAFLREREMTLEDALTALRRR